MCDNKELLVSYLYDDLDAASRHAFDAHLATCAECRHELAGLRSTRTVLASWAPPEPSFGFRIVRGAAAPPAPPKRWFRPAWGFAAAAVVVLAAGAAIANVEVRYGQDGLVVRTGWARTGGVAPATQAAGVALLTPVTWKADLELLDRRLRELEAASALRVNPNLQVASAARMSDTEFLRRVKDMISQNETLQRQEFGLRMTELARQVDRQRRVDLAMMQQGLEGASGAAVARDTQLMNYLRLVTQQK